MRKQKARPSSKKQGSGTNDGASEQGGQPQSTGHDLLSTDSNVAGVGSAIESPAEAREIDRSREEADRSADQDAQKDIDRDF